MSAPIALQDITIHPVVEQQGSWFDALQFFPTLTKELLVDGSFRTREEGCREVFTFIEIWYNRQRRHSALGYQTPSDLYPYRLKQKRSSS